MAIACNEDAEPLQLTVIIAVVPWGIGLGSTVIELIVQLDARVGVGVTAAVTVTRLLQTL